MGAITQAMAKAAREAGVEIVLDTPVEEVIVEKGRAAGAVAGGKAWRAKAVVAGVHPKRLFTELLPEGAVDGGAGAAHGALGERIGDLPDERRAVRACRASPRLPEPGDHLTAGIIIAPSLAYMDRAYLTARTEGWSKEPVVEMLIPSTLDDSLAPGGQPCRQPVLPAFPL